jgi:DNA-binding transcriptional regulator YiaG
LVFYQNKKGRILKPAGAPEEYLNVTLVRRTPADALIQTQHTVHFLVMLAFKGRRDPPDLEVNHIDGVKNNNILTNLEYVTCLRNVHHALEMGLRERQLTMTEVNEIRSEGKTVNQTVLANRFGVSNHTICTVLNNMSYRQAEYQPDPKTKITDKQVAEIRSIGRSMLQKNIADNYNISISMVSRILNNNRREAA